MFLFLMITSIHSWTQEYRTYKDDVTISSSKSWGGLQAFLPPSLVSPFLPLRFSRCTLSSFFFPLSFLLQVYACKRFMPFYSLQHMTKKGAEGVTESTTENNCSDISQNNSQKHWIIFFKVSGLSQRTTIAQFCQL